MGKFYDNTKFQAFWWSVWDLLQGFIVKNVDYDWETNEVRNKNEYIQIKEGGK